MRTKKDSKSKKGGRSRSFDLLPFLDLKLLIINALSRSTRHSTFSRPFRPLKLFFKGGFDEAKTLPT